MTIATQIAEAHREYIDALFTHYSDSMRGLAYAVNDTPALFDRPRMFASCAYCSRISIKPSATCEGCGAPLTLSEQQANPTIVYDPLVFDDELNIREGFQGRLSEHMHVIR